MASHTCTHLHTVVRIKGGAATPWLNESMAFGIKWAVYDAVSAPSKDIGEVTLPTFEIQDAATSRSHSFTTWGASTCYQGWTGSGLAAVITDADIDLIGGAFDVFWNSLLKAYLGPDFYIEGLRIYALDQTGKSPTAPIIWTPNSVHPGTASAQQPPQLATVVTLQTASRAGKRGVKGRGRFYLPQSMATSSWSHGKMNSASVNSDLTNVKTLVDTINGLSSNADVDLRCAVVHADHGTAAIVNQLRLGDVIDTQRRRRRQLVETYVSQALA